MADTKKDGKRKRLRRLSPDEIRDQIQNEGKTKSKKNPPAKTKISSVSKEKAEKDKIRTRVFNVQKRKRPLINLFNNAAQAKRVGNVAAEGGDGEKSYREKLDAELKRSRLKKFLRRTRKEDKKKSEKDKKKSEA